MVNWTSPEELAKDRVGYVNVTFAFFGLYVWEVFQTSDFEWAVLTRRRKIRWHWVMFLFLCRYCLILSVSGLMASFSVMKGPINCQALYTFIAWAGNMSLMCASTVLAFRTVAVWERKLAVAIPLGVLGLGLWALLWRGMFIMTAEYDATSLSCVVTTTKRTFLSITFWATMGYNLVLTVVHTIGLMQRDHGASLWEMLFEDGLLCYIVAFAANVLPAVLSILNLNPVINVISAVPAAAMTAMAACRTVTRLSEVGEEDDLYVHSATQISVVRPPPQAALRLQTMKRARFPPRPEVHVTTDHIVVEDYECVPSSRTTPIPSRPSAPSPESAYTSHSKPPELTDDKSETERGYDAV
ncbi:uncharacterized protein TRAVEDRAFT_57188 [Trametes versicolor FP-101664 SS1]|uniref:uncharacterized protein n=1 Tax=Trametes versicolor (strain FP-101664) TaxID=717944 RepID=UPI000462130C|nr:uncharacterized protein TRAVEDRAFT_57188 [Trametes versicolor FP-101664 SS1]EIW62081.1 hypothetical protein TRAVEDRAFT_57188 [Trametes versicolor FP-101664 SS1]